MHQNGIRERLLSSLVQSHPLKPEDHLHPNHHLQKLERQRRKAVEVERLTSHGKRLPDLTTIRERLARLCDEDYLLSEAHQRQLWAVDQGGSALVAASFVQAFLKDAAALKIPLYAPQLTVTTATVLHCQWRYSLPAEDWAILAYIGKRAAKRVSVRVGWAPEIASIVGSFDEGEPSRHDPGLWAVSS